MAGCASMATTLQWQLQLQLQSHPLVKRIRSLLRQKKPKDAQQTFVLLQRAALSLRSPSALASTTGAKANGVLNSDSETEEDQTRDQDREQDKELVEDEPSAVAQSLAIMELLLREYYAAGFLEMTVIVEFLKGLPHLRDILAGCRVVHQVDATLESCYEIATENFTLAFFLTELLHKALELPFFQAQLEQMLYEWFSLAVRSIVMGKMFVLHSVDKNNEVLYTPAPNFDLDSRHRHVFCWADEWTPDLNKEKWCFVPCHEAKNLFWIQNVEYQTFLVLDTFAHSRVVVRRPPRSEAETLFDSRPHDSLPGPEGQWQLVITWKPHDKDRASDHDQDQARDQLTKHESVYALYNPHHNRFLYAASVMYDGKRRYLRSSSFKKEDVTPRNWTRALLWSLERVSSSSLEEAIEAFHRRDYPLAVEKFSQIMAADHQECIVRCLVYRLVSELRMNKSPHDIQSVFDELKALGGSKAALFYGVSHLYEEIEEAFGESSESAASPTRESDDETGVGSIPYLEKNARDHVKRKQFKQAVESYAKLVAQGILCVEDKSAELSFESLILQAAEYAKVCLRLRDHHQRVEAISLLEKLGDLTLDHTNEQVDQRKQGDLWLLLGRLCRHEGLYEESVAHLTKALDLSYFCAEQRELIGRIAVEIQVVNAMASRRVKVSTVVPPSRSDSESPKDSTQSSGVINAERLHETQQLLEQLVEVFTCPLSLEPMQQPVTTPSGNTFEREMIEKHLAMNGNFDPLTRCFVTKDLLVPNKALEALSKLLFHPDKLDLLLEWLEQT